MHSFSANLIQTKLRPPGSTKITIKRKQVFEQFFAPPAATLILLNAPAGYGKTTTMCEWWQRLREGGERTAWLSLDQNDQNASTFLSYLIASLDMAGLEMGDLVAAAHSGLVDSPTRVVLSLIVNRIVELDSPLFLFLDDYHLTAGEEVNPLINEILNYAQGKIHVVIATRIKPELAIADLKLKRDVKELGIHDLRFSREEGLIFVGQKTDVSSALVESSEGWPAALQLARLWLEGQQNHPRQDDGLSFTGRSSDLAAYLAEQVFSDLPERLQGILIRTALIEHFNGDLINILCDCDDGWGIVENIKKLNMFITSYDGDGKLIFHQLFREFLLERAKRLGRAATQQIYITAAMWFCDQGRLGDALVEAGKSEDLVCISTILQKSGGWTLALRAGVQSLRPLMSISSEEALQYPDIALTQMYLLMQFGKISQARELYRKFKHSHQSKSTQKRLFRMSCDIINNTLNVYEDNPFEWSDFDETISYSKSIVEDRPSYYNILLSFICYSKYEKSDFPACIDTGEKALLRHVADSSYYAAFFVNCYIARAQFMQGDILAADATLQNGIKIASDHYSVHSAQVSIANVFLAQIAYENNNLKYAKELLDCSLDVVCERGGWFEVLVTGFTVQSSLLLQNGDAQSALDMLDRKLDDARDRDQFRLHDALLAHKVFILVGAGDMESAWAVARGSEFQSLISQEVATNLRTRSIYTSALRIWADLLSHYRSPEEGLTILDRAVREVDQAGNVPERIAMRVAAARLANQIGERDKALNHFSSALEIEAGRGLIRSFLDQGDAVIALAHDCLTRSKGAKSAVYHGARKILAESPDHRGKRKSDTGFGFLPVLSNREQQVLELLSKGFSSKEMAHELGLAEGTIKVHRKRLYRRLQVHSRSGALAIAETKNLLP